MRSRTAIVLALVALIVGLGARWYRGGAGPGSLGAEVPTAAKPRAARRAVRPASSASVTTDTPAPAAGSTGSRRSLPPTTHAAAARPAGG
ncbi:MAG: hypothetical protein Q8P41_20890, partial [Pseudomonadota bacterium]|nr:hypothetical protein [Pseudomonadota bacterium]